MGQVAKAFSESIKIYAGQIASKILNSAKSKTEKQFKAKKLAKYSSSFNFLGYKDLYQKDCEPLSGWGATQTIYPSINVRTVTITEGQPINKDQCLSKSLYTPDAIRRMIKYRWFGKKHVILMTHGAHFSSWHPLVYYNRMIAIRDAILEFKKAEKEFLSDNDPDDDGAKFIYRTPNYARGNFTKLYAIVSGFEMYRLREIAFKIFGNPYLEDMRGEEYPVKVYDSFGPTLAAFPSMHPGNVHPPGFLRESSSDMLMDLLDYIGVEMI